MATYKLVTVRHGYPLALAGEYTACTFTDEAAALKALGPHIEADGYAGTFNPRHPAATEYDYVARSLKDSSLYVVVSN